MDKKQTILNDFFNAMEVGGKVSHNGIREFLRDKGIMINRTPLEVVEDVIWTNAFRNQQIVMSGIEWDNSEESILLVFEKIRS